MRCLSFVFSLLIFGGAAQAMQEPEPALVANPNKIEWVLPKDFDHALERAKSENRMLLIKGISFGVDDVGASCATKGRW